MTAILSSVTAPSLGGVGSLGALADKATKFLQTSGKVLIIVGIGLVGLYFAPILFSIRPKGKD